MMNVITTILFLLLSASAVLARLHSGAQMSTNNNKRHLREADPIFTLNDGSKVSYSEMKDTNITALMMSQKEELQGGVDCDHCYEKCKWWDGPCLAETAACQITGAPMEVITDLIELHCSSDFNPDRYKDVDKIEDAKDILINNNLLKKSDFAGVDIHYCDDFFSYIADSITPSPNRVVINSKFRNKNKKENAIQIAHGMVHIYQYRRHLEMGFNCRYSVELRDGVVFGREISLEKEAYDFEKDARKCIENGNKCHLPGE